MTGAEVRYAIPAAVHIFLIKDSAILLAQRRNTGYADGKWSVPSGHVEAGETVTDAAIRETLEEVGVLLDRDYLSMVHVMHRRDENGSVWINFFFVAERWSGEPTICEPHKCGGLVWLNVLDSTALPVDTIPYVAYVIEFGLDGETYSEEGWGDQQ